MNYPILRLDAGRSAHVDDAVITETRIELDIDEGRLRVAMLCLPDDLEALAAGFLLGQGAITCADDIRSIEYLADDRRILIRGDFQAEALDGIANHWTLGTGCGGGGTGRDLGMPAGEPVGPGRAITPERLCELAGEFGRRTDLWRRTGGTHACALAGEDGIGPFAEDIGRHNAFDKVMGKALLGGVDVSDKFVLTTGRLSAEIVSKAVTCRVPMLASRSAVTDLAVKLANRFGMTLVGFLRGQRMNVYTGYRRIAGDQDG